MYFPTTPVIEYVGRKGVGTYNRFDTTWSINLTKTEVSRDEKKPNNSFMARSKHWKYWTKG